MAYAFTNSKGNTYYLHKRETALKNGRTQSVYFFAKEVKDGSLDEVPAGYEVSESRNGLPVLRRKNLVDKEEAYAFTNSKGNTYYLHKRETALKNGRTQTVYFFAKDVKDGSLDEIPAGYEVSESGNGLPVLRRKDLVDKEGAYAFTNSKGNTYYLHKRETALKNGRTQTIYFFAKEVKDGSLDEIPAGYEVSESGNGLPVLRKR